MNSLTGVTQRIISSVAGGIRSRLSRSRAQLVRILDECVQAAGDGRAGGVVTGGGDDEIVRHRFDIGQRFAVDAGVGDRRREILGRMFAARRGHRVEVLEHVQQRRQLIPFGGAALELAVVAAEQLLGQLEHAREVGFREAQQRHDHVERVIHRDLLGEVAFGARRPTSCRRRSWPVHRPEPSTPASPSGETSPSRSRAPRGAAGRPCGSACAHPRRSAARRPPRSPGPAAASW